MQQKYWTEFFTFSGFLASGLRKILGFQGLFTILGLLNRDMFNFHKIFGIAPIEPTCAFIKNNFN